MTAETIDVVQTDCIKDIFKGRSDAWQKQAITWLMDKGSVAVILACWLAWSIYDSHQKDLAKDVASKERILWEEKFWDKVDARLTQITTQQVLALEKAMVALERSTDRLERRIDERKIK